MTNGTGIVPTMPIGNNNGFGMDGEWIFGLIFLAAMFNGGFGGFNRGGEYATAGQVASQGTQNMLFDTNNNMSNGFGRTNDNICDARQAVYNTGASLSNQVLGSKYDLATQILENKYAGQLAECNTQRDILTQTNELSDQASINALQLQGRLDMDACEIKTLIREDGEKTRALITENTINDLREKLNSANNIIEAQSVQNNVISAIRPYPTPSYLVSSPYSSIYNPYNYAYGYGNGFYGNGVI